MATAVFSNGTLAIPLAADVPGTAGERGDNPPGALGAASDSVSAEMFVYAHI